MSDVERADVEQACSRRGEQEADHIIAEGVMTVAVYAAEAGNLPAPIVSEPERDVAPVAHASHGMLKLFVANLDVRLQCIDQQGLSEHQRQIAAKVADALQALRTAKGVTLGSEWDEVYRLERLIALLFNGPELKQEIGRRLAELAEGRVPEADRLRQEYAALIGTGRDGETIVVPDGVLRTFLLRAIETLQWAAKRRYLAQPLRQEATKKILICVLATFVLLVGPYVVLGLDYESTLKSVDKMVSPMWSHLGMFTALASGCLGAFFSRLMLLQRNWPNMPLEELGTNTEWSFSLLRAGVGMCGALILYYFFHSGLIDGSIFPHVDKLAVRVFPATEAGALEMAFTAPSRDLALLTVWCFLGGFSEVLVPGLLAKTEGQFAETAVGAKAR
jgi:hypothetical protein